MTKPELPRTDLPRTDAPRTDAPRTDAPPPKAERAPWEWPFAAPFAMPEAFTQIARDQIARTQTVMEELAIYEGVAVQRARAAVNDLAKLATDSLGYLAQLSAEWRKVAVDASRKATDAFTPKA